MTNPVLESLSREELLSLIDVYAKNWLALDGVWFQSVERELGMDAAMHHDLEAWRRYTVIEARRLKAFLGLSERAGLEGLERALSLRFYGSLNQHELVRTEHALIYRNFDCRVQTARARKGMPYHPCKSVGEVEYAEFARVIDERITCRCLSCYPVATERPDGCAWEFALEK